MVAGFALRAQGCTAEPNDIREQASAANHAVTWTTACTVEGEGDEQRPHLNKGFLKNVTRHSAHLTTRTLLMSASVIETIV